MARNARHSIKKWVRNASALQNLLTHASTGTAQVIPLVPPNVSDEALADWTIRRCRGSIALKRIQANDDTKFISMMVYIQQTNAVNGEPLSVLNPLSTDPVLLGNRDILDWQQLPTQATQPYWNSLTDTPNYNLDRSTMVHNFDIKVNRKLRRLAHGLFLVVVGDASDDFNWRMQCSTLLSAA